MQLVLLNSFVNAVISSTNNQLSIVTLKTDKGNIIIELYPECAPKTVANFVKLVETGFYDGLSFHRYVKDFVIQGGDPDGTGTGGPGWTIPGEFQDAKLRKMMPAHEKGVIAMARKPSPNSAGSQFYICLNEDTSGYTHLNGSYTTFGRVIEGIDVIDQLREGDIMNEVTHKFQELDN
ncbi:MAG: peptidylprolyl isomerase [Candidatus Poribacteria bacterium]|nr:peptidylprolyl isomerase [Candidatus Poribacteria bacterium]